MSDNIFTGCMPALMTPCTAERQPDFDALVAKGRELIDIGMSAVVYCGSMGDWPLLTEAQRQEGVARLVAAGVPTIVGTGAVNSREAVSHAAHAAKVGAHGLMVIPRVLSRGASVTAQKAHFAAILNAAPNLPAVIYNSPYYGFATRADLFFELRREHPNLIGFKEFGGAADLRYAAENITSQDDDVLRYLRPGDGAHAAQKGANEDAGQAQEDTDGKIHAREARGDQADGVDLRHHIRKRDDDGGGHGHHAHAGAAFVGAAAVAGGEEVGNRVLAELAQIGRDQ